MKTIFYTSDHYFYISELIQRYKGDTVLDIGCCITRNMLRPLFKKAGYQKISVLEISSTVCQSLRRYFPEMEVTYGDVRNVDELYFRTFDTVVWWHGPQDVKPEEFKTVLQSLLKKFTKHIILGGPADFHGLSELEQSGFEVSILDKQGKGENVFVAVRSVQSEIPLKPSVGIVTTWFERGASHVSRAFMDLLSEKFDVRIYARGGEFQARGQATWDLPNVTWQLERLGEVATGINLELFGQWLQIHNIQTVLFNEQRDFGVFAFLAREFPAVRKIAYVDYYTTPDGRVPIESFDVYDKLLCCTQRHFQAFYKVFLQKAVHVPWGTNLRIFQPTDKPDKYKENLVFFHNAGMIGVGGRKGTFELLETWKTLDLPKDVILLIHSQVPLPNIDLPPNIEVIVGSVPHPGYYSAGDVYVYPSRLDGIGLTLAEALASGLPVITTDEPPMNEFVTSQVGRLIEVKSRKQRDDLYYWPECKISQKSLAEQIMFFVHNRDYLQQFKTNARIFAEERLDWSKNKKLLEQVFG